MRQGRFNVVDLCIERFLPVVLSLGGPGFENPGCRNNLPFKSMTLRIV
jgi:hypothetical protein